MYINYHKHKKPQLRDTLIISRHVSAYELKQAITYVLTYVYTDLQISLSNKGQY